MSSHYAFWREYDFLQKVGNLTEILICHESPVCMLSVWGEQKMFDPFLDEVYHISSIFLLFSLKMTTHLSQLDQQGQNAVVTSF